MAPSNDFIRLPLLKCERASISWNRFSLAIRSTRSKSFSKEFYKVSRESRRTNFSFFKRTKIAIDSIKNVSPRNSPIPLPNFLPISDYYCN